MNATEINLKQILPTVLICGLLGGGLLLVTTSLPIKGWWSILTYPIVVFATMFTITAKKKIQITYAKTFVSGVLTFMIMSTILYFYIALFENPNSGITFWGHTWRFLAMLGFAIVSGAILGLFFTKPHHKTLQTS